MLHREHLEDNYIYVYLKVSTEVSLRRAQTPDVSNMWATPSFQSGVVNFMNWYLII